MECCSGGTSVEIAARMRISQSTFQNHLHAMRTHLGVSGKDSIARLVGVRLLHGYRTWLGTGAS
jgi:DNA-binding CsgD family transcriptional regulator